MARLGRALAVSTAAFALMYGAPASAALQVFNSWVGSYGLSTDGGGTNRGGYNVSAFVPVGATVVGAYLYQATLDRQTAGLPMSFAGNAVTWDTFVPNTSYLSSYLGMARADVTSIVASVINGGAGGTYDFAVDEGSQTFSIDGSALAVVYSLPSLAESTVALLDGFSAIDGDTTSLNFATPLDPTAPGFTADMRLGIGFSCCSQASDVSVNGTLITTTSGNNDDGGEVSDGSLITVGGNNDPFSPLLPSYSEDHERYNLAPYIKAGDTSIRIDTNNPSDNDNIFLAAFQVSGRAGVNEPPPPPTGAVPEPGTWAMMIVGFGVVGGAIRSARRARRLDTARA